MAFTPQTTSRNGQRFQVDPTTLAALNSDPGTLARQHGYASMDEAASAEGVPADELTARWIAASPAMGEHQVADSDHTVPLWQVYAALAAAGLGGGLLGSALGAAGGAGTGAAATSAGAGASSAGLGAGTVGMSSSLGGALGASTALGAAPAAGVGVGAGIGTGLSFGAKLLGIAGPLASAGTQLYSAYTQSKAAKDALAAQTAASDKALAWNQQQYADAQRNFAPYRQAGQQAVSTLGALMTAPGSPGAYKPGQDYRQQTGLGFAMPTAQPGQPSPFAPPPARPQMGAQPASSAVPGQPNPPAQPGQPNQPNANATITMRAPDGTTKQVPAFQQAFWQAKGATVIA